MTADLIARLVALTGPDRETDAEIWADVNGLPKNWTIAMADKAKAQGVGAVLDDIRKEQGGISWRSSHYGWDLGVAAYTASIDAAVALVERGLPRADWRVTGYPSRHLGLAEIRRRDADEFGPPALGATPAIALCIAMLRAREAQGGKP